MTRKTFHHASEAVRRQELITATLDCIAEYGLQATTVRQIARQANVTGGLIRHYFASKDNLLQAAYGALTETMSATAIRAADDCGGDARTRLRTFILANFELPAIDAKSLSLWAAFIGQTRIDPQLAAIHRQGYLTFRNKLQELLGAFLSDNKIEASDGQLRSWAIALNGLFDGLWLEGCLAEDLFEENELAGIALKSVEAIIGMSISDRPEPFFSKKDMS